MLEFLFTLHESFSSTFELHGGIFLIMKVRHCRLGFDLDSIHSYKGRTIHEAFRMG